MPKGKPGRVPCTVPGCTHNLRGHGLCNMHLLRMQRHGSLDDLRPTVEQRFWAKVQKTDSCWLWTGAVTGGRYGAFYPVRGEQISAHRWSYTQYIAPIPDGLTIDHVRARGCTSTLCVRPDHLEAVTMRTNVLRGASLVAENAAKTHCKHGHPFDLLNTYIDRRGRRGCWTCIYARTRMYRARAKRGRTP